MQMESKSNRKVGVYSFEERAYIIERYRLKRSNSQAQNRLRFVIILPTTALIGYFCNNRLSPFPFVEIYN